MTTERIREALQHAGLDDGDVQSACARIMQLPENARAQRLADLLHDLDLQATSWFREGVADQLAGRWVDL